VITTLPPARGADLFHNHGIETRRSAELCHNHGIETTGDLNGGNLTWEPLDLSQPDEPLLEKITATPLDSATTMSADIGKPIRYVRFTPKSGHTQVGLDVC
jgi:hypothetical protein